MRPAISLIFLFISLILESSCSTDIDYEKNADIKTDLETYNIKGNVSMIEQESFDLEWDNIINKYRKSRSNKNIIYYISKTAFNKVGNRVWNETLNMSVSSSGEDLSTSSRDEYYYDDKQRLKTVISTDEKTSSEPDILNYIYDKHNNLIEITMNYHSKQIYTTRYKYNSSFKVIEEVKYNKASGWTDSTIYEYNDEMNYETVYCYFNYDTLGQIIKKQYDQDMRIVLLKSENRGNPKFDYRVSYKYNEFDDLIEETTIWFNSGQHEPSVMVYKYTFDKNNNWTTRTKYGGYKNQIPLELIERKINYFDK